jgi:hypothetical protein
MLVSISVAKKKKKKKKKLQSFANPQGHLNVAGR